jgi:hypothetical protein
MTKYTLSIVRDGERSTRSTEDEEAAIDWFTNAATALFDPDDSLSSAELQVDGVIWGLLSEDGITPPEEGGEVIPLRRRRKEA